MLCKDYLTLALKVQNSFMRKFPRPIVGMVIIWLSRYHNLNTSTKKINNKRWKIEPIVITEANRIN